MIKIAILKAFVKLFGLIVNVIKAKCCIAYVYNDANDEFFIRGSYKLKPFDARNCMNIDDSSYNLTWLRMENQLEDYNKALTEISSANSITSPIAQEVLDKWQEKKS